MVSRLIRFEWKKVQQNVGISFSSILGLSLGLSVFILGFLYFNEEWSHDKGFTEFSHIFRIERLYEDGHSSSLEPTPMADLLSRQSQGIACVTKFSAFTREQPLVKSENGKAIYIQHLFKADSSFFSVFDFPFLFGGRAPGILQGKSIVLSKGIGEALFGQTDPVGKSIIYGEKETYTVSGVFDNSRFSSHLIVDAIIPLEKLSMEEDPWRNNFIYTYLRLSPHVEEKKIENVLTAMFQELPAERKLGGKSIRLNPITNLYLHSHAQDGSDVFKKGNETALWLIFCLTLFMLIGSVVNFTNLTISEASNRTKEIAIRRFVGANKRVIIFQWYIGMTLKCLLAVLFALLIVIFSMPYFEELLQTKFALFNADNLRIWSQIGILLCIVILVTGSYPLVHISFMKFAANLKGNFVNSRKGNSIRKVLLVIQFTITCVFISGVLIISKELRYLSNKDLGFKPKEVLVIRYGQLQTQFQYSTIKSLLSQVPGVESLSYSSEAGMVGDKVSMPLTINGVKYSPHYICVDTSYFNVLGGHVADGKDFSYVDTGKSLVINRTLARMAGIKYISHNLDVTAFNKRARIIGIADDMNFYGFENSIGPMVFTTSSFTLKPFLFVKLKALDVGKTIAAIKKQWEAIEPGYPLRYQFLDQSFEQLYHGYERMNGIFRFFSVIALILAFMGLFTLSSLISLQKLKEITIRKVHGASKLDILKLLNRNFLGLIILSNILAWPLTFYLAGKWLDHFAYRIEFTFMPYLVSLIISIGLTITTVSLQSLKAISASPIEGLRE